MNIKCFMLFFVHFCLFSTVSGQNTWQTRTDEQIAVWGMTPHPSGGTFSLITMKNNQFGVTFTDFFGGQLWTKSIGLVDSSTFFMFARGISLHDNNRVALLFELYKKNSGSRVGQLLVWIDGSGNFIKSQFFDNSGYNTGYSANKLLATPQNQLFGCYNETVSGQKNKLRTFLYDGNLDLILAKKYETALAAQSQGIISQNVAGEFLVCGSFLNNANQNGGGFLMKIDQNGVVNWSKKVSENHVLQFTQLADGSYLYVASTSAQFQFQSGILVKLDASLNPIWAKKYPVGLSINNFRSIAPLSDGSFHLIFGENNVNTAKTPQIVHFAADGTQIWSKRFNECRNIDFSESRIGEFDFLLGNRQLKNKAITYFKMSPDGEMGACSTLEIPVNFTAAALPTFQNLTWTSTDLVASTAPDVVLSPENIVFSDFCPPQEFPVAHFTLPDSVCFLEKMQPFYDGNGLADAYLWNFENGRPDSSVVLPSDSVRFFKKGLAKIQLVQTLGICRDTFVDFLRVLSPLPSFNLPNDTTICASGELILTAKNTQFFDEINWENGSTDPNRTISEDKLAILTGNLGICTLKDSVKLTFAQRPDLLPADTTNCADATILANFPRQAGDVYFWNENPLDTADFLLKKGRNELKIRTPEGCELTEIFDFLTVECLQSVFVPNIFSPNDDGENDFMEIFGSPAIAKIVYFEIFDRWGNLVFSAKNYLSGDQKGQWNGLFRGKKVLPSVFTWHADLELVDGRRVKKAGNFTVI